MAVSIIATTYSFMLQLKEAEVAALNNLLKEKNPDEVESLIYHVLRQRHFRETVQLANQHERQKSIAIEEKKHAIREQRDSAKDKLIAEQEKEIIELISNSTSMSNPELAKQKLQLKKKHKKQLADFDKETQQFLDNVSTELSPSLEIKYNEEVLALRERHIRELADAMQELSPEQALIRSYQEEAERASKAAEAYRKEVIEVREKKIAELKLEKKRREESRSKLRDQKVRELEAEIEREKQKNLERQTKLEEKYSLIQKQRLEEQEALHQNSLSKMNGISEQEREVS